MMINSAKLMLSWRHLEDLRIAHERRQRMKRQLSVAVAACVTIALVVLCGGL